MAWEWVAPVATAAGVSIVGVTTWLAGASGRTHAETIAKLNLDHAERMAHLNRNQTRLEEAYVALLEIIERSGTWATSVHPIIDNGQAEPPLPTADDQVKARARVRAHGSTEVFDLLGEYVDIINMMISRSQMVRWSEENRELGEAWKLGQEARQEIQRELRPQEQKMRLKIGAAVAEELRLSPPLKSLPEPLSLPINDRHPVGARFLRERGGRV